MTVRGWIVYGLGAACRLALWIGVSLLVSADMTAREQSAKDFVALIYANYQGAESEGVVPADYGSEASLRQYFEPSLAALLREDRISAMMDAGRLKFDPFVGSGTSDLNGLDISIDVADPVDGRTVAIVTFARGTEKIKLVKLDLAKLGRAWRISNIHWGDSDLRTLLSGR